MVTMTIIIVSLEYCVGPIGVCRSLSTNAIVLCIPVGTCGTGFRLTKWLFNVRCLLVNIGII